MNLPHFCNKRVGSLGIHKSPIYAFLMLWILLISASIIPFSEYSNGSTKIQSSDEFQLESPHESGKNLSEFILNPTDLIESVAPQNHTRIFNDDFQKVQRQSENDVDFHGWDERSSPEAYLIRSNEIVYSDAYSGKLVINQTRFNGNFHSFYQSFSPNRLLTVGAIFSFAWRIEQFYNFSTFNDYVVVRIFFNNSRSISYYIAGDYYNSSNEAKYLSSNGNTTGSWFTENQTLYNDYTANFGIPTNVGISSIYATLNVIDKRPGPVIVYFDSFRLLTNAQEIVQNPGFESAGSNLKPNNWDSYEQRNPILRTDNYSVGKGFEIQLMTNQRIDNNYTESSFVNIETYPNNFGGVFLNSSRKQYFSFSYRLESLWNLTSYESVVRIEFYNLTYSYYSINIYIATNSAPSSNSSNSINIYPSTPQGSWGVITLDLYSLVQMLDANKGDLILNGIRFNNNIDSLIRGQFKVQFANLEYKFARYGEASYLDFENYTNGVVPFDFFNSFGDVKVNNSVAKSGQKSLCLSAVNTAYSLTFFFYQDFAFTPETSIQFDYFLNYTGPFTSSNYASVSYYIYNYQTNSYRSVIYILGASTLYSNSSDTLYMFLSNSNKTGVWQDVRRNLYRDYEKGFGMGSAESTYLSYLEFYVATDSGSSFTFFIDDLKTGSTIPLCENSTISPSTVLYNHNSTIVADLFDSGLGIKSAKVYYRLSSSDTWKSSNMSLIDADSQQFSGIIPSEDLEYNKTLEYYIEFEDYVFNKNRYPISSALTASITDRTAPKIHSIFFNPSVARTFLPSDIYINASDDGAGIVNVTLFYSFDGVEWLNQSAVKDDQAFYKARVIMPSGFFYYSFLVVDGEGNIANSTVQGFANMLYVEGLLRSIESFGAGFAAALILFIIIKKRKRSKT